MLAHLALALWLHVVVKIDSYAHLALALASWLCVVVNIDSCANLILLGVWIAWFRWCDDPQALDTPFSIPG